MAITIELPRTIELQLQAEWNGEFSRKVLEAIAIEGYREGVLSRGQVSEILGLSFHDAEAFLKERDAYLLHSMEELDTARASLERLLRR